LARLESWPSQIGVPKTRMSAARIPERRPFVALALVGGHAGLHLMIGEADRAGEIDPLLLQLGDDEADHPVGRAVLPVRALQAAVEGDGGERHGSLLLAWIRTRRVAAGSEAAWRRRRHAAMATAAFASKEPLG
jgi:hypothetical protein